MIITNSLGSNYSGEDIKLSLSLLFQPWKWKRGKEVRLLENEIATSRRGGLPPEADRRNDVSVRLFYKGRQAIGEALKILKIGPGDEVIVQAFTCVAVVNPILEAEATPVYVDVAPKSLNPLLSSIKSVVTPKTKAIILQHTLGYVNSENEKIVDWCRDRKISVIQDLAHAFGAPGFENLGESLGTLSFSQDKVVDGVSGGGLVLADEIATSSLGKLGTPRNDDSYVEIGKLLLYPICTWLIRSTYQLGIGGFSIGKGIHWLAKSIGLMNSPIDSSIKPAAMPNAPAALALTQLKRLEETAYHRRKIALLYNEALADKLKIVSKKDIMRGANLRYPIWVKNRDELEEKLQKYGFYLVDHWYDAPVSPEWVDPKDVKYRFGSCPNAEDLSKHIFNLPTHVNISARQAEISAHLDQESPRRGEETPVKKVWESALDQFPEANFLQSWEWGEFHKNLGHPVFRVKFSARGGSGMLQGVVEPARRGRYLEIPGGPLLSNYGSVSLWKQAVLLMKQAAKKERCVFIRIRPQISRLPRPAAGGPRNDILPSFGFRPAAMHLHAELTRVLDLTKTGEQLLAEMRKSTRYEIKRAVKMGIKVEQSRDENLAADFIRLQTETAKREGFVPFSRKYLLEQFRAFKKANAVRWFFVSNQESPGRGQETPGKISMAFVIFYRGEAVYHYAASNAAGRLIPAAYAIQWAIIAEAKKRGMKTYNLWGDVADDKLNSHRFAGPSLFKRGFGGEQVAYLHAHDLPLSWKYWVNWGIETIRKKFRSL